MMNLMLLCLSTMVTRCLMCEFHLRGFRNSDLGIYKQELLKWVQAFSPRMKVIGHHRLSSNGARVVDKASGFRSLLILLLHSRSVEVKIFSS